MLFVWVLLMHETFQVLMYVCIWRLWSFLVLGYHAPVSYTDGSGTACRWEPLVLLVFRSTNALPSLLVLDCAVVV